MTTIPVPLKVSVCLLGGDRLFSFCQGDTYPLIILLQEGDCAQVEVGQGGYFVLFEKISQFRSAPLQSYSVLRLPQEIGEVLETVDRFRLYGR